MSAAVWLPTALVAVAFALMGALGLYRPQRILAPFGIRELSRDARNEVRAVYGGFGLAVAALLLYTLDSAAGPGVRAAIGIALAGMAGGRVVSAVVERGLGLYPRVFLVLELVMAGALLAPL